MGMVRDVRCLIAQCTQASLMHNPAIHREWAMRIWRTIALSACACACISSTSACLQRTSPSTWATANAPPPAPPLPTVPGTPLPTGWVWPFDPANAASVFALPAIIRPVDAARLTPFQGRGPCTPHQAAPNVWVTPDCEGRPKMLSSPAVPDAPARTSTKLPAAIDLRVEGLDGPIKHQQMVGICWSFALSTVIENAFLRAGSAEVVAPLHLVSSKAFSSVWQTGSTRLITREKTWPYDPIKGCKLNESPSERWCAEAYHVRPGSWRDDPELVAEIQKADASGVARIVKAEKIKAPVDPDLLATQLADGRAVFADFDIDSEVWSGKTPEIPDWEAKTGGHAVVISGYRTTSKGRQFLIHNSWGPSWREHGYAWLSERMIRTKMTEGFIVNVSLANGAELPTVKRPGPNGTTGTAPSPFPWPFPFPPGIGGTAPAPPPGGGIPAPGSNGCPQGQARDVLFGQCTPLCQGGSPSVAGICPNGVGSNAPGTPAPPAPAPTPSPAPTPAPGSQKQTCAPGQVRDWITGACAAQCSNGLPPAAGICVQ